MTNIEYVTKMREDIVNLEKDLELYLYQNKLIITDETQIESITGDTRVIVKLYKEVE